TEDWKSPEARRLLTEAARLMTAADTAATTDEATEFRMDAARSLHRAQEAEREFTSVKSPSPSVDEVALPTGCKMHSPSRYASDLDCTKCGLGEGDACREYHAIADASIAAKRAA